MAKIYKLKPSQRQAEEAVRTLMAWAGDDPGRQGLRDTPSRVRPAFSPILLHSSMGITLPGGNSTSVLVLAAASCTLIWSIGNSAFKSRTRF
jgi:hypothetical protein